VICRVENDAREQTFELEYMMDLETILDMFQMVFHLLLNKSLQRFVVVRYHDVVIDEPFHDFLFEFGG
jgi:hypothetical protein